METNNTKNMILITQPIFGVKEKEGKKIIHHSSIINYGKKLGDGIIEFVTNKGKVSENENSMPYSIKLFNFEDICLENLMSHWRKYNGEFNKPILLDESIETHEVYSNNFSPLKIMIERREKSIAIKPLFENL